MGFITKGDVSLNINGVDFELDSTDMDLIEKIDKFSKEAPVIANENSKREDIVPAARDTIEYALGAIDSFLGEGASDKIFENEKVSIFKATSVINYINDEITKAREVSIAKFSPNRAQRRKK